MVNLTLIPIWGGMEGLKHNNDTLYPIDRISFSETVDIDRLMEKIKGLHPKPLPAGTRIYLRERSDKPLDKNPSGERITYLFPIDFKKLKLPKANAWDRAVLTLARNLPPNTMILLFWW